MSSRCVMRRLQALALGLGILFVIIWPVTGYYRIVKTSANDFEEVIEQYRNIPHKQSWRFLESVLNFTTQSPTSQPSTTSAVQLSTGAEVTASSIAANVSNETSSANTTMFDPSTTDVFAQSVTVASATAPISGANETTTAPSPAGDDTTSSLNTLPPQTGTDSVDINASTSESFGTSTGAPMASTEALRVNMSTTLTPLGEDDSGWASLDLTLQEISGEASIMVFSVCVLISVTLLFLIFYYAGAPGAILFNIFMRWTLPAHIKITARGVSFALMGGKIFFNDLKMSTPSGVGSIKAAVARVQWWNKRFLDARHPDGANSVRAKNSEKSSRKRRIPFRITIKCRVVEFVLTNGTAPEHTAWPRTDVSDSTSPPLDFASTPARHWIFNWFPSVSYEINGGCVYVAPPHLSLMWAIRCEKAEGVLMDLDHPSGKLRDISAPSILYRVVNKMMLFKIGIYLMPTHEFDRARRKLRGGVRSFTNIRSDMYAKNESPSGPNPHRTQSSGGAEVQEPIGLAATLRALYQNTMRSLLGGKGTDTILSLKEKYVSLPAST